jgi:hypothetical protein
MPPVEAAFNQGFTYDEDWLKDKYPLTCAYLLKFEKLLRQRSGFRKYFCKEVGKGAKKRLEPFAPFYSLYNIGEYTLAPFKVCWREQAEFFTASVARNSRVAGKTKIIIPDHKLMFVPLDNETEAHFVCAAINSTPSVLVVKSYGIETQTSTHVLEHVGLPKFDAKDNLHQHLAQLSKQAHAVAAEPESDTKRLEIIEAEIDETVAKLWSITPAELDDIKFSLADLR